MQYINAIIEYVVGLFDCAHDPVSNTVMITSGPQFIHCVGAVTQIAVRAIEPTTTDMTLTTGSIAYRWHISADDWQSYDPPIMDMSAESAYIDLSGPQLLQDDTTTHCCIISVPRGDITVTEPAFITFLPAAPIISVTVETD